MIKRNDEFERIADIMLRFGKEAPPVYPPTRGYTAKDERLVHVLIIGSKVKAAAGVTNSHGPGLTDWSEIYMDSTNGGLSLTPEKQAIFVKDDTKKEKKYTFRGIYEVDDRSTGFKMIFRRIATEVDETLPEWQIVRFD